MKEGEAKQKLSPAQVSVMLHRVTEPPYFGKYWDSFDDGVYRCAACETALFSSDEKFDSKTGWPSFKKPLHERDLQFKSEPGPDDKVEIRCKKCKSHLGYVIASDTPYYRINSVCLVFEAHKASEIHMPNHGGKQTDDADIKSEKRIGMYSVEAAMESVAAGSWSIRSLAVGAVAGALVGAGATALYLSPATSPVNPETASSTGEIASTSADVPTAPEAAPDANVSDVVPAAESPVAVPESAPESTLPLSGEATSTQ